MVGSDEPVNVDVRIISASNRNLREQVDQNAFRADLYYRLAVIPLTIPALRDRPGDVPVLIKHFCNRMAKRGYQTDNLECSPDAMKIMLDYPWPGNVRELENAVEHGIICSMGENVGPESLPQHIQDFSQRRTNTAAPDSNMANDFIQRNQIQNALNETRGNKARAAQLLGIDRSTLWRRMQKLGVEYNQL